MGNLEILRAIAVYQNDIKVLKYVESYLYELAKEYLVKKSNFISGDDSKSFTLINLFLGKAGIGYNFLRQAYWEICPSILSLESCNLEYKNLHTY